MNGASAMGLVSAAIGLANAVSATNEPTQVKPKDKQEFYVKPNWFSYKDVICIDLSTVYSIRVVGERVRFSLRKDGNVETIMLSSFDRTTLMREASAKLVDQV